MKALVRHEGETVTKEMGIDGIDWKTGAPLTNTDWCGGRYTLVENYTPPVNDEPESYEIAATSEETVTVTDDTVVIDGKEYTKEELRALLGE